MLYKIVRPLATIALKLTFRKIYFTNKEYVPKDKPVILAVNHPTIFLEPCLLACFLPRPLYFLARGNLFSKPLYSKILKSLHLIPIFRMKDGGFQQMKSNLSTLDYCSKALSEKKVILIMAEGFCIQEKRLRPIRKGPARLAFGTFEKYGDLDIQMVPVGVNYTYPDDWREEVMFEFGPPISIGSYKALYESNPNQAIRELSNKLETELRKLVIHIEKKADEPLLENLFVINRNKSLKPILPIVSNDNSQLQSEIKLTNTVNEMSENYKVSMAKKARIYFSNLSKYKIKDFSIAQSNYGTIGRFLILLFGLIPFLIGYVFHLIPFKLAEQAGKPIEDIEDRLSIVIAVAIITFLLYYIGLVFLGFYFNKQWIWGFIIMLPFWGYFSLLYRELYQKWIAAFKSKSLDAKLFQELKAQRAELSKL